MIAIQSDENPSLNSNIQLSSQPINKYGQQKIKFSLYDEFANKQERFIFNAKLKDTIMCQFEIQFSGQSLNQRIIQLKHQIDKINKNYNKYITIQRKRFMENLQTIAKQSLFTNFKVVFDGELGIDAGGLKRQFYNMIGQQMKKSSNPFFLVPNQKNKQYFFNSSVLKNKKKNDYMQLFGKFLANSILNDYMLGIKFSPVFIKLLYQHQIQFEDFLTIVSQKQAKSYQHLLSLSQPQFQDLYLFFQKKTDEHKGIKVEQNIQVTKSNLKQYFKYLINSKITDRYKDLILSFRKGFQTVLPLEMFQYWIKPTQFWCLTQGIKQITPEIIFNYINFDDLGGKNIESHIAWFRRYIFGSNLQVLQGFLKFSTGSSSIDFNQNYKITVKFQNAGENPKKLPISHTCWKQINIPKYKSYEIMHKLLNVAFIYCSDGFGFL